MSQADGTSETPLLRVELLGGFRILHGDADKVVFREPRLQSLLTYLVLHRNAPQSRAHLSFLFWPDSAEGQAKTNLRKWLHHLRRTLPEPDAFLLVDAQTIQWKPGTAVSVDVADFDEISARAEEADRSGDSGPACDAYRQAALLYGGDLLPSCYDDWIEPERERLRRKNMLVLERLVHLLEQRRTYDEAIQYAERLLRQDDLAESSYRTLMRLHALAGNPGRAIKTYERCASLLRKELGRDPDKETRQVHEELSRLENKAPAPAASKSTPAPAGQSDLPLVGREREWEQLRSAWNSSLAGETRTVLIFGEAGIGKTRLAEELLRWASQQGIAAARARCHDAEGGLAYAPVMGWLRAPLFQPVLKQLDSALLGEVARVLPELLRGGADVPRPAPMRESWQRLHFFEALGEVIRGVGRPLLLVLDDLHWCDRDSLQWLHYLLRLDLNSPLLFLGTVRSDDLTSERLLTRWLQDLRQNTRLTEIALGPLDAEETASLASHLTGTKFEADRAAELYRQTEGHPLFVVESLRAGLLENGPPRSSSGGEENGSAPSSVGESGTPAPRFRAVIESRLGRLSESGRALAELAATNGHSVPYEVLSGASGLDSGRLADALDELWQRRILGMRAPGMYDFSHDKLREIAYARISPARRRLLHHRSAEVLESLPGRDADGLSGRLAFHYERAGLPERALPHYLRAGEVAQAMYADEEAILLLSRGLNLIPGLPQSPECVRMERQILALLGSSLIAARGYTHPRVGEVYERARSLCPEEDASVLAAVLLGLWAHYLVRADLGTARRMAEQLADLAERRSDSYALAKARFMVGATLFHFGELGPSGELLESTIDLIGSQERQPGTPPSEPDLTVLGMCYLSHVHTLLGDSHHAGKVVRGALARARMLGHPFSQAISLCYAAVFFQFCGDPASTGENAEAAIALCTGREFAYYLAVARILRGWVRGQEGSPEEGIEQMRSGLAALRDTGAELRRPYYLSLLAETLGEAGKADEGISVLNEALAAIRSTGELWLEAELHRLRGDLLEMQGAGEEQVEGSLQQALKSARKEHARLLELRAAIHLARLWIGEGRRQEARRLLERSCRGFPEPFDTADGWEASALREELA